MNEIKKTEPRPLHRKIKNPELYKENDNRTIDEKLRKIEKQQIGLMQSPETALATK